MCGNRVDELESRVQELEASVEGLTDELVECKVRLRELEDAVDEHLGFVPEVGTDSGADVEGEGDAADSTNTEASQEGDSEGTDSDIIVA